MPRTIETTIYTIEEHPNPDAVFDWIRDHWHDRGEFYLQEVVESIKAFAEHIGATPDWSISIVPDRGEYIRFQWRDSFEPDLGYILESLDLSGNCPFTGVCYDETILDAFREASPDDSLRDVLHDVEYRILKDLHNEGEYIYSDEGLREFCEINGYEFTATGEMV